MGLVPQEDSLDLELTVLDNLVIYGRYFDMPKKVIRERAEQLLDFAQLTERATPGRAALRRHEAPAHDRARADLPAGTGHPRRADHRSRPQARHLLWDRLYRLKQDGVTLVITTHYMDEAEQLCDRLVVMDQGRFAAEGSPRQLIEEYATKEVVEMRFAPGEHEQVAPSRAELADRQEVLPDRLLLYADDGDAALAEVARWATSPGGRSCGGRRWRTCSSASPGAPWSTEPKTAVGGTATPGGTTLTGRGSGDPAGSRPHVATRDALLGLQYKRTWRSSVGNELHLPGALPGRDGRRPRLADRQALGHVVDGVTYLAFLAPGSARRQPRCRSGRTTPPSR